MDSVHRLAVLRSRGVDVVNAAGDPGVAIAHPWASQSFPPGRCADCLLVSTGCVLVGVVLDDGGRAYAPRVTQRTHSDRCVLYAKRIRFCFEKDMVQADIWRQILVCLETIGLGSLLRRRRNPAPCPSVQLSGYFWPLGHLRNRPICTRNLRRWTRRVRGRPT